jgi:hypothetical protein
MEAAASTSSFGYAVFEGTPSQRMVDLLCAHGGQDAIATALRMMGYTFHGSYHERELPCRALVHMDEAILLAYIAVAVSKANFDAARKILDLDKDHQAPYTIRAWAPGADRPATHMEVDATRAAGLHEARIWMRRQPTEPPPAAEEQGLTVYNRPPRVLASCPLADREHAVSQLEEALAYCKSFAYEVCEGCWHYELIWPACRGEYCMGCILAWYCEHP